MASTRFNPIIYVRGFAMSQGEIDETTADPFCGFNLGSTVYRANPDRARPPRKYVFESPMVRLASDFGYEDTFREGLDIMDEGWSEPIPGKSVVIYRYYESASTLLGEGPTPEIEDFATGLSDLILRIRDFVCADTGNGITRDDFRCHLVAHSMGGLVCRAFLQNPKLGKIEARRCVDKVFTYATPHNGIDMAGINVPKWLSTNDISNFNRERMADYLDVRDLYRKTGRVDWLPESAFPSERFFCMIGTNRADYEVAQGLSRTFSGNGSDGLVKIENASVWGVDEAGRPSLPTAKAFAYRSHSGYFGIVNSEESYQNLVRFLFGDVRVDIWVDIDGIGLPPQVREQRDSGKKVDALYQFEVLASPRGKLWYLTRRMAEEDSVACLRHQDWEAGKKSLHLSSVFLSSRARVDPGRPSLAYGMTLRIRVPDYEVENRIWPDEHYEGGCLFQDSLVLEMVPPMEGDDWQVVYDWQSDNLGRAATSLDGKLLEGGKIELPVGFESRSVPGIAGRLRFIVSRWNAGCGDWQHPDGPVPSAS